MITKAEAVAIAALYELRERLEEIEKAAKLGGRVNSPACINARKRRAYEAAKAKGCENLPKLRAEMEKIRESIEEERQRIENTETQDETHTRRQKSRNNYKARKTYKKTAQLFQLIDQTAKTPSAKIRQKLEALRGLEFDPMNSTQSGAKMCALILEALKDWKP